MAHLFMQDKIICDEPDYTFSMLTVQDRKCSLCVEPKISEIQHYL